ncbi:MAG: hypothetical protein ABFS19_04505 [Thermodesulfobacteriota bacterium]
MKGTRKVAILVALVCVSLSVMFLASRFQLNEEPAAPVAKVQDTQKAPAETGGEKELTLTIGPKPIQTMKLLSFRVQLTGYREPEQLIVDLSMPGMVMGINRFNLEKVDANMYEGKSIIPTCSTGKTLWLAKVIIDHEIEKKVLFNVQ